jgi:ABC-2 type transport system permease protein
MNANSSFSAARVTPNLAHAWGGIWRLTFRRLLLPSHWLMVGVGLAVLALILFGGVRGEGHHFVEWIGDFYVAFLVPVVAFMAAGGTMRDEMRSGTVDYVLTRPVPRPAFIVFKYLAHTLCAQLDFLVAFVVVAGFVAQQHPPALPATLAKLLLGQVLMVAAFGAFGILCGVLTSRYVVIGLAYAAVIEVGVGQIPTQISRLSMTHQVRDLLAVMLGRVQQSATTPGAVSTFLILIAFSAVTLAIAAAIFTWRELSSPTDT